MVIRPRFKAALIHLLSSLVVASIVAATIIGVWFPGAYAKVAHGWQLVLIILFVDATCGPLLTAILFNPSKSRRELTLDMGLVILIQLSALSYGIHVAFQARPVVTVFEGDRFRIVTASEIDLTRLAQASPELRELPANGPRLIAARIPQPGDADFGKTLDLAIAGLEVSFRPGFWRPYDGSAAVRNARPLSQLTAKHPGETARIDEAIKASTLVPDALAYLPVQTRRDDDWVALLRRDDGQIVGFVPLDGF